VETARGAAAANATFVVSSLSTRRMADIAHATSKPLWFQLYGVNKERHGFVRDVVQEVKALGCRALCVTVDAPVLGARNRQARAGFRIPDSFETPYYPERAGAKSAAGLPILGSFSWDDVAWLRSSTTLPILLKGILNPEDAELAIRAGVDGIIVSNHGGRCLDTLPATTSVLPSVAEKVAGRVGHGRFTAFAFGGGVDVKLTKRLSFRALDAEYQYWPTWGNSTLSPYGASMGIGYKIF